MKTSGVTHPALDKSQSNELLSDVLKQTQHALSSIKIEYPQNTAQISPQQTTQHVITQNGDVIINSAAGVGPHGGGLVSVSEEFTMDDNFPVQGDPMMSVSTVGVTQQQTGGLNSGETQAAAATINLADVTDMLL